MTFGTQHTSAFHRMTVNLRTLLFLVPSWHGFSVRYVSYIFPRIPKQCNSCSMVVPLEDWEDMPPPPQLCPGVCIPSDLKNKFEVVSSSVGFFVRAIQYIRHTEMTIFEPPSPPAPRCESRKTCRTMIRNRPVSVRTTHPLGVT